MKAGKLIVTAACVLTHFGAYASRECDWAIQVRKDESWRIDNRNGLIHQKNAAILAENTKLANELRPLKDSAQRTLSVYDFEDGELKNAHVLIGQVTGFMEEAIVSNSAMTKILEKLNHSSGLSRSDSLANHIRDVVSKKKMSDSAKSTLTQLANSVALLESQVKDWKAQESEILEAYFGGKSTLIAKLFGALKSQNEQLGSKIKQLAEARKSDQSNFDDRSKQVGDAEARIAGYQAEIAAMQTANANSAAYMQVWDMSKHCPSGGDGGGGGGGFRDRSVY